MDFEVDFDFGDLFGAIDALTVSIGERRHIILAALGETLYRQNSERHLAGLAPDGTPWKPLAPSTIGTLVWKKQRKEFREGNTRRGAMHHLGTARRIMQYRRTLFDTGEMLHTNLRYQVFDDVLHVGFSLDRALWHHEGTDPYTISPRKAKALSFGGVTVKRVNHPGLPARPLIGFPEDDRELVGAVMSGWLTEALLLRRRR